MAMTDEEIAAKQAQTEAAMRRDGVAVEERVQEDYFGTEETHQAFLPDGISYIEHRTLSHGDRKKYLNKTNRDMKINRGTGDASISLRPGDEKDELLKLAACGWNLKRQGTDVPFSAHAFEQWLTVANPKHTDIVEKEIRKHNPWLMAELSVEDLDQQISDLQELREAKIKEEEGKAS